jgi:hypothetical protein
MRQVISAGLKCLVGLKNLKDIYHTGKINYSRMHIFFEKGGTYERYIG